MLGRTADDLFWMSRYIERAENMARLAEVGFRIALHPRDRRRPSRGMAFDLDQRRRVDGFLAKYGEAPSTRRVVFMLFDEDNPSSVRACAAARNAAPHERSRATCGRR